MATAADNAAPLRVSQRRPLACRGRLHRFPGGGIGLTRLRVHKTETKM